MSPLRILLKATVLVLLVSVLFASVDPSGLGKLSLYNHLFPGRERLPFGENQQVAYNLSLYNLDAMFASHVLDGSAPDDGTYRVFLLGDSSVWGTLLTPGQTLAGQLDAAGLTICGKPARFYNLGYPSLSLAKDLMLLERAMRYQPDQVVWLTTLESFPRESQLAAPILANNPEPARDLIDRFDLALDPRDTDLAEPTFPSQTLFGRRRDLADLVRLQLYGVMWAATGVDQTYPEDYERAALDLAADEEFHGRTPTTLDPDSLALDVLEAGHRLVGDTPMMLVNEPILVSQGANSDIRYNFFYPRWAYDQYRQLLAARATERGWQYLDLWDLAPPGEFTNSAIHLTPSGEALLAGRIAAGLEAGCR
jgi:hypothetical protein